MESDQLLQSKQHCHMKTFSGTQGALHAGELPARKNKLQLDDATQENVQCSFCHS
ncbi:hypothetical protein [Janthinobacterium agaricidamnosum]|uniref:hypothetical protein n=1 Tax=Janthinobacterium agaricidamnosum TaxID=55508 RepID=UPI000AAF346D|nr:hypothetical protein [Janthinobacterium agaricidamnosum]